MNPSPGSGSSILQQQQQQQLTSQDTQEMQGWDLSQGGDLTLSSFSSVSCSLLISRVGGPVAWDSLPEILLLHSLSQFIL